MVYTTDVMNLESSTILEPFYKRFLLASAVWLIAWPLLYYVKIGEITGPKAWFWIVGEINYPIAAIAYVLVDTACSRLGMKSPWVFVVSVSVIALCMPYYYEHYGFALGVSIEARFL